MKLLLIAFACVAAVAGDVSHLPSTEYLPSIQDVVPVEAPVSNFIPEVAVPAPISIESAPSHILTDDGYRYKTHRRVVYRRNRRDVSHLPSNDYLPPVQEAPVAAPVNEYLPPVQQTVVAPAPVYAPAPVSIPAPAPIPVEAAPAHILSNDGYRYKTNRRVVYRRNRRDVSHLPSNDYLPPVQEAPVAAPVNEYLPPVQQTVVAPAPVYTPAPVSIPVPAPIPVEAAPAHILSNDGYRYKTNRRVVYRRNRRDVSHLPSNDYLPPVQEAPVATPVNEYLPPVQQTVVAPAPVYAPAPVSIPVPAPIPVEAAPAHILSNDGYRYKTNRRVVYRRNRRDVSHLPSNDYLPPVQETPVSAPVNEYLPPVQQTVVAPAPVYAPAPVSIPVPAPIPVEAAPAHILANDGYRYKTHRRVVYRRNRRDVSHLPSNDYLPPVQETPVAAPVNEYLPPVQQTVVAPAPVYAPAPVEAAPAHILTDDGYRYKTHRRVIYRRH